MYIVAKTIKRIDDRTMFWSLIIGLVAMSVFYIFAVNKTVIFVAERDSVETKVASLRIDIAELDSQYIAYRNKITMDLASSLGYKEAKQTSFVPKKAVSFVQTGNAL